MNRAEWESVIKQVGVPATLTQTAPPQAVATLPKVGIARVSGESLLVNAYGVGARILTIMQSSMVFEPVKFDVVEIQNERLVLDFVQGVYEPGSGVLIGWRGIVRGK